MIKNIGESDRIFRLAAGIAMIIIGLVGKTWWGLLAIPLLGTAFWGYCPVYHPFGINTRSTEKK